MRHRRFSTACKTPRFNSRTSSAGFHELHLPLPECLARPHDVFGADFQPSYLFSPQARFLARRAPFAAPIPTAPNSAPTRTAPCGDAQARSPSQLIATSYPMTASYDSKLTWANIDEELKDEVILKIAATLECLVCSELMHVPFLAQCGHSFCYGCLNAWFESKVNCPTCRKDMENAPVLNIQLRDVSKNISDVVLDSIEDKSHKKLLQDARQERIDEFDQDNRGNRLFGDAFKSTLTLVDTSDGVPRCGNCHWEAHGSVCLHCGSRFRVPRSDLYYDSEDGDAYNEDQDEVEIYGVAGEQDDYDSADSFVDDRDISAINEDDYELENDGLPPDLDDGILDAELWEGFNARRFSSTGADGRRGAWLEDVDAQSPTGSFESAIDEIHDRDVAHYMDMDAEEVQDENPEDLSVEELEIDGGEIRSESDGDDSDSADFGKRDRRSHWVVDLDSE